MNSNSRRIRRQQTAPRDDNGLYAGDLTVESLRSFVTEAKFPERWQSIAESMGYEPPEDVSPTSLQMLHYEVRFVQAVFDAGIWMRGELNDLLQDNSQNRVALESVYEKATAEATPVYAVPFDLLTFLIVCRRRTEFVDETIRELGFKEVITHALLAIDN